LSFFLLGDKFTKTEKDNFAKFVVHSLSFIDFEELPYVTRDFEADFVQTINPIFAKLYTFYDKLNEQTLIEEHWKKVIKIYVKRKHQDSDVSSSMMDRETMRVIADG
jgi:hypothetical protein